MTHDNIVFEKQWPDIFDQMQHLIRDCKQECTNNLVVKNKVLNSIVDYMIAEPTTCEEPIYLKTTFVRFIFQFIADDPQLSLADVVHSFKRILDIDDIFNQWHLFCLDAFRSEFQLFARLTSTKSFLLIKLILDSLQKHSFLNDKSDKKTEEKWQEYLSTRVFSPSVMDLNKLNHQEIMVAMRPIFQQFFR